MIKIDMERLSYMLEKLSIYMFIYYFFVRVLYTFYGIEFDINIWIYRIGFYVPMILWFLLIFIYYYKNFNYLKHNKQLNLVLLMFLYISFNILYHKFFGLEYITSDVINFQIKNLFYSILNLLLGLFIYNKLLVNKTNQIFLLVWVLYLCLLFANLSGLQLDKLAVPGAYLLIADTFVVVSIIGIFTNISSRYLRIFLFTAVLIIVYAIKSRASFYSLLVVYMFFIAKEIGIKNFLYLIILAFFSIFIIYNFDLFSMNRRMFGVFEGRSDGSLSQRLIMLEYGWESIKNNWFFGEFAGQILTHDIPGGISMGNYIHNWLSYWRQYGLVLFLLLTMMYANALYIIFKKWIVLDIRILNIVFYLALFTVIELLLFRSYSDTLVWFVLGLMYMYIYYLKNNNELKESKK